MITSIRKIFKLIALGIVFFNIKGCGAISDILSGDEDNHSRVCTLRGSIDYATYEYQSIEPLPEDITISGSFPVQLQGKGFSSECLLEGRDGSADFLGVVFVISSDRKTLTIKHQISSNSGADEVIEDLAIGVGEGCDEISSYKENLKVELSYRSTKYPNGKGCGTAYDYFYTVSDE